MGWEHFLRKNYPKINQLGIGLNGLNTLRFDGNESFEHRLIKFLICHNIFEAGHHFKTEQLIKDSICDVIDLDTLVIYEIEANATLQKNKEKLEAFYHPYIEDIVIIDSKKLGSDWPTLAALSDKIRRLCNVK